MLAFDGGRTARRRRHRRLRWPAPNWRHAGQCGRGRRRRTSQPGCLTALLFALFGGVLLNLMPCVFPVLSLKVLSLRTRGRAARSAGRGALAYTAGVVLSFVALAGLLLALRAAGEQLGWGFQLQSPASSPRSRCCSR